MHALCQQSMLLVISSLNVCVGYVSYSMVAKFWGPPELD